MILTLLVVAALQGCKNSDSNPESSITRAQRTTSINSAMEHLDAGNVSKALAIVTVLVEKDPDSADSQEAYALVLLSNAEQFEQNNQPIESQDERKKALTAYQLCCELRTNPGLLELSTAQLAHMIGELQTAKTYYERAHHSNPDDARASFFLAQMAMLETQWQVAHNWITQSMERSGTEPYTLLSAALIEANLGNYDVAIQLANRGCKQNPNNPNLRFIQARVFRIANQPNRALELLHALPVSIQQQPLYQEEIQFCKENTMEES